MPKKKIFKPSRSFESVVDVSEGGSNDININITDLMFANLLTSQTFCINLVNSRTTYHIHEEVLSSASDYFRAMLASQVGREKKERMVDLQLHPLLDRSFPMVIEYMYTAGYNSEPVIENALYRLIHIGVYLLADRFLITKLKSLALSKMRNFLAEGGLFRPVLTPSELSLSFQLLYEGITEFTTTPCELEASSDDLHLSISTHNSSGDADQGSKITAVEDPRRDMQLAIASYAAGHIKEYRGDQGIQSIFKNGGIATIDVIIHIGRY